jgi:hypothetical protein
MAMKSCIPSWWSVKIFWKIPLLAVSALSLIGVSARVEGSLPSVQKFVISLIWANNEICPAVIHLVLINVVNLGAGWKRLTHGALRNHDMFKPLLSLIEN